MPLRNEWQQTLVNRLVERFRQRPVMEYPKMRTLAFRPMRFAFKLKLSADERGDGLNGVRNREGSGLRQARIRQTRVNAPWEISSSKAASS